MGPLEIGALGFGALFVLMVLQVPIGFAMIIVGVVGFALQAGWAPAVTLLVNEPTGVLSSADLATVPLFLLMGTFASVAGFSTDIIQCRRRLPRSSPRRTGVCDHGRQRRFRRRVRIVDSDRRGLCTRGTSRNDRSADIRRHSPPVSSPPVVRSSR